MMPVLNYNNLVSASQPFALVSVIVHINMLCAQKKDKR